VLAAARKLKTVPDLFMFDGQGYAHPRRVGLASHAGLMLDMPTIGAAKSRLIGEPAEPPPEAGTFASLVHRGEGIGAVLRTRQDVRPIYVSVGHRVTLDDAIRITLACVTRYRLPEPTRLAHQLVTRNRLCRSDG
jgi:deoxyribonuclease V